MINERSTLMSPRQSGSSTSNRRSTPTHNAITESSSDEDDELEKLKVIKK